MKLQHSLGVIALAVGSVALANPAYASACSGVNVGTSSTSDFSLNGADSFACVVSNTNPDSGPNGDPSGFSPTPFGIGWALLAKINSESGPKTVDGVSYNWALNFNSTKDGTWSFGADQSIKLDLVVAMHGGSYSGAFLFDDITLLANQTQNGTWLINWVNNGGNRPDYSNSSLWIRDVTPVPEPESYALALAGLAVVGLVARRRKTR